MPVCWPIHPPQYNDYCTQVGVVVLVEVAANDVLPPPLLVAHMYVCMDRTYNIGSSVVSSKSHALFSLSLSLASCVCPVRWKKISH